MRVKEIIQEGRTLQDEVASAIPSAYVIPALPNQDPYKQYRFGIALANARSLKDKDKEKFQAQSSWGENAVVVSYSGTTEEIIDSALKQVGLGPSSKKQIAKKGSRETSDVSTKSPVAAKKTNKYGV